jgi:spore maturation protein SpmA
MIPGTSQGTTDAERLVAWIFLIATVSALSRWLLGGDPAVFAAMVESLFAMAKLSVEVMVILFGTPTLWLGVWAAEGIFLMPIVEV